MKILFAGGGSLGPVTPLLAVAEAWKEADPSVEFLWVGTPGGPEGAIVKEAGIRFLHLPVARLPRYPSLEWFLLPLRFIQALMTAWSVISRESPSLVATAGGYTGVPLAWVAVLKGIPVWSHQPDVRKFLSIRCVAPVAKLVTVAWPQSAHRFFGSDVPVIGNPVRPSILRGARDKAFAHFGLDLSRPTILVVGGGGGAQWINEMVREALPSLLQEANVLHVTGPGKSKGHIAVAKRYAVVEQLAGEMGDAMALADIVITRAGMGAIAECAALAKATIVIPLPGTPQVDNAQLLADTKSAIVLTQALTSLGDFTHQVTGLVRNEKERRRLGSALHALLPTDTEPVLKSLLRLLSP